MYLSIQIPIFDEPDPPRERIPERVRVNALMALVVRALSPQSQQGLTEVGIEMAAKLASCRYLAQQVNPPLRPHHGILA